MPKYIVSADIFIPILVHVEAEDEAAAEVSVEDMDWREALRLGFSGDSGGVEISVDMAQLDENAGPDGPDDEPPGDGEPEKGN